ncbi:MAG: DegV family protein [Lachnospiraceae bacterium]|nr:DegV family protein [Candidatus Equihabitans merdae]
MVKIMSDSTCDLSKELIEKNNIDILPLHILLGDKEYRDGIDITPDEIYTWADANKTTPKTSASGMEDVVEAMRPYVENGDEIVVFTISQSMSTNFNVMRLAADELEAEDKIHVIDSANLSTGIGLLVLTACDLAAQGKSAAEIADEIEKLKSAVRASFVVDTLVYLHRGGRCSGVEALAGQMLKLHPRIEVVDGAMRPAQKYRGKIHKVVMNYVKDMENDLKTARKNRVFITHSGCDRAIVEEVEAYLKSLDRFENIYETRAGGVISSHCGPGTLGVLFIAE